jgi:uncharacterized protein (DUF983 family)
MSNPATQAPNTTKRGALREVGQLLWAMLRQRCPRCRQGRMFRGLLATNDPCPVCGLIFQREEGSFLGAMYVSYVLSAVLTAVFYFTLAALLPGWNGVALASLAILPYLPFVPLVFRYSRVVWVYLDRVGEFSNDLAGPYEKYRLRELAEKKSTPPQENHCSRPPQE